MYRHLKKILQTPYWTEYLVCIKSNLSRCLLKMCTISKYIYVSHKVNYFNFHFQFKIKKKQRLELFLCNGMKNKTKNYQLSPKCRVKDVIMYFEIQPSVMQ